MHLSYRHKTILVMYSITTLLGLCAGLGVVAVLAPPRLDSSGLVYVTPATSSTARWTRLQPNRPTTSTLEAPPTALPTPAATTVPTTYAVVLPLLTGPSHPVVLPLVTSPEAIATVSGQPHQPY